MQTSGGDAVAIMPEATSVRLFQTIATKAAIHLRDLPWPEVKAELVSSLYSKTSAQRREAGVSKIIFSSDLLPSPVAMLFVTREGSMGVLEVLGPSSNPRGVKLRYKLVQNDSELRKQAVREGPPLFNFQFRRDGSANGGKNLVEFRMILEDGVAENITLKPESGIEGDIERLEREQERDFYSVTFNSERGFLPPVWNFSITYNDKNQKKIKRTYAVVIHADVAPPNHFEVRLADESYRTNVPAFNFAVGGVGPRGAVLTMTRMGKPVTHFKMQSPPGLEGHFNNLQTTVNYDQQDLVFNAQTNGLPEKWKFSIEFLADNFNFHRHFFEVTYQPTNKWDKRLIVKETPERLVRNVQVPELQFLAWQDEWQTKQPGAVRHPDGSPVTDAEEIKWLKAVPSGDLDLTNLKLKPEPRILHLWFSHPNFRQWGFYEVILSDDAGKIIKLGGDGSTSSGAQDANDENGNRGWNYWALSPGAGTNLPPHLSVCLRYTIDALERTQEISPYFSGMMSLEGRSQLNAVGQNVLGRAFVAIAVDAKKLQGRQFDVVAITKDGRELPHTGWGRAGPVDDGVRVENFDFTIPLTDVAKFIIGTRPVRTMEWKNVVLPK